MIQLAFPWEGTPAYTVCVDSVGWVHHHSHIIETHVGATCVGTLLPQHENARMGTKEGKRGRVSSAAIAHDALILLYNGDPSFQELLVQQQHTLP